MAPRFQIPNFFSQCPFELRISPYCRQTSNASDEWLRRGANLTDEARLATMGLKAGLLASMCYPTVDSGQLRVCADFTNLFFYIKAICDSADVESVTKLADVVMNTIHHPQYSSDAHLAVLVRNLWTRLQKTCPPSVQRRLSGSIEDLFRGLEQQVYNRVTHTIPDLESFISLRREDSACLPAFILIEYAHGMRLPHEIYSDPIIVNLTRLAMDLVCWSNDIISYNLDQSRRSSHNIVAVVMSEKCLDVQAAVNYVGSLYRSTLDLFVDHLRDVPSWGEGTDAEVETYLRGLQDWIIGSLHWSFETERYFGDQGDRIRTRRMVTLDPPRQS